MESYAYWRDTDQQECLPTKASNEIQSNTSYNPIH